MTKIRSVVLTAALFVGAVLGAQLGFGGGVPSIPSSPTFNEPSQIVSTLNAFINQLNGNPLGSGGYAAQPLGVVSIGSFCSVSGVSTNEPCNGTRGSVGYTAQASIAAGGVATLSVTNGPFAAGQVCPAWVIQQSVAASSEVTVASTTPGGGNLTVVVQNPTATATGAAGAWTLAYQCIN
jgi:hypothetical protein